MIYENSQDADGAVAQQVVAPPETGTRVVDHRSRHVKTLAPHTIRHVEVVEARVVHKLRRQVVLACKLLDDPLSHEVVSIGPVGSHVITTMVHPLNLVALGLVQKGIDNRWNSRSHARRKKDTTDVHST